MFTTAVTIFPRIFVHSPPHFPSEAPSLLFMTNLPHPVAIHIVRRMAAYPSVITLYTPRDSLPYTLGRFLWLSVPTYSALFFERDFGFVRVNDNLFVRTVHIELVPFLSPKLRASYRAVELASVTINGPTRRAVAPRDSGQAAALSISRSHLKLAEAGLILILRPLQNDV